MSRLLGADPAEVVPARAAFLKRVHPDDLRQVEHITELLYSNEPFSTDHRVVLADGSVRFVAKLIDFNIVPYATDGVDVTNATTNTVGAFTDTWTAAGGRFMARDLGVYQLLGCRQDGQPLPDNY